MSNKHTVEKIGGTSMTSFGDIMNNVIIGKRSSDDYYNRVFIVSAYGGVTDLLLEHKKSGEQGVYAKFADKDSSWKDALEHVRTTMLKLNKSFVNIGLDIDLADKFFSYIR